MQNQIIKEELLDNTVDSFIIINPTKPQLAFFPKEESQMFTSKTPNYNGVITGQHTDYVNESENTDTRAFINRTKAEAADVTKIGGTNSGDYAEYNFKTTDVNSSHTATDYIGATSINVPTVLDDEFVNFSLYIAATNSRTPLYDASDTATKISNIVSGIQRVRIPANALNETLEDEAEIEANGGSTLNLANLFTN
jgi:hypothetical protein